MVFYSCSQLTCPILKLLFESKNNADVQLCAGENGNRTSAHKNILSSATEYFKGIFEKSLGEDDKGVAVIRNMNSDTLEAVIQFIYCGTVEISSLKNAIELSKVGYLMELPYLVKCCEDYLTKKMSYEHVLQVYVEEKLVKNDKAREEIAKNLKNISQKTYFKQLEKDSLVELIKEIQDSACEDDIVEGMFSWLGVDQQRLSHFKELLQLLKIESIKQDNVIDELFKYCSGKDECGMLIISLQKRSRIAKNNSCNNRSRSLIAFAKVDKSKYSLIEFDFANKTVLAQEEVQNYGNVLGFWEKTCLFQNRKELMIYDIVEKSISPSIEYDFNLKTCRKINEIVYILSEKCLHKLNLSNSSFDRIDQPEQFNDYKFDAMCELDGELKVIAYLESKPHCIEVLTYNPLYDLWNIDSSTSNIKYSNINWISVVVAHKYCLYYFTKDNLHIYDLEYKEWRSIKNKPKIYSTSVKSAVSIDDKLIICTWSGTYECIVDEWKLKDLDFSGIKCGDIRDGVFCN